MDHMNLVEYGSKLPHHRFYQLFPSEQRAVKHYIESFLRKERSGEANCRMAHRCCLLKNTISSEES